MSWASIDRLLATWGLLLHTLWFGRSSVVGMGLGGIGVHRLPTSVVHSDGGV